MIWSPLNASLLKTPIPKPPTTCPYVHKQGILTNKDVHKQASKQASKKRMYAAFNTNIPETIISHTMHKQGII